LYLLAGMAVASICLSGDDQIPGICLVSVSPSIETGCTFPAYQPTFQFHFITACSCQYLSGQLISLAACINTV